MRTIIFIMSMMFMLGIDDKEASDDVRKIYAAGFAICIFAIVILTIEQ